MEVNMYPEDVKLPGYQPVTRAPRNLLDSAVKLIEKAKKPVILCGHGVMMSGAEEVLQHFAIKTNTPVAMTLLGLTAMTVNGCQLRKLNPIVAPGSK